MIQGLSLVQGLSVVFQNKIFTLPFQVKIGPVNIRLNPIVSIVSAVIIWAFVIACIVKPKESLAEMKLWQTWITDKWTWLYIGTQDVWAVFIVVLYFSKYGDMKLGKDDEKPEFKDATYFTMLFAAGIGIGLFYFGVAEPIWHYAPGKHGNRYWGRCVFCLASLPDQ